MKVLSENKNAEQKNSALSECKKIQPSQTIVHAQLEMTTPGDADEVEANAMADAIVGGGKIRRQISNGTNGSGIAVSAAMENQLAQTQGGGRAMPDGLRNMMENGFGRDFSNVRIHTDSQAATMSQNLSAKAFTLGNDIYFNKGQFSPNTTSGQHLIAHELTHVVQGNGKVGRDIDEELIKRRISFMAPVAIGLFFKEDFNEVKANSGFTKKFFLNSKDIYWNKRQNAISDVLSNEQNLVDASISDSNYKSDQFPISFLSIFGVPYDKNNVDKADKEASNYISLFCLHRFLSSISRHLNLNSKLISVVNVIDSIGSMGCRHHSCRNFNYDRKNYQELIENVLSKEHGYLDNHTDEEIEKIFDGLKSFYNNQYKEVNNAIPDSKRRAAAWCQLAYGSDYVSILENWDNVIEDASNREFVTKLAISCVVGLLTGGLGLSGIGAFAMDAFSTLVIDAIDNSGKDVKWNKTDYTTMLINALLSGGSARFVDGFIGKYYSKVGKSFVQRDNAFTYFRKKVLSKGESNYTYSPLGNGNDEAIGKLIGAAASPSISSLIMSNNQDEYDNNQDEYDKSKNTVDYVDKKFVNTEYYDKIDKHSSEDLDFNEEIKDSIEKFKIIIESLFKQSYILEGVGNSIHYYLDNEWIELYLNIFPYVGSLLSSFYHDKRKNDLETREIIISLFSQYLYNCIDSEIGKKQINDIIKYINSIDPNKARIEKYVHSIKKIRDYDYRERTPFITKFLKYNDKAFLVNVDSIHKKISFISEIEGIYKDIAEDRSKKENAYLEDDNICIMKYYYASNSLKEALLPWEGDKSFDIKYNYFEYKTDVFTEDLYEKLALFLKTYHHKVSRKEKRVVYGIPTPVVGGWKQKVYYKYETVYEDEFKGRLSDFADEYNLNVKQKRLLKNAVQKFDKIRLLDMLFFN